MPLINLQSTALYHSRFCFPPFASTRLHTPCTCNLRSRAPLHKETENDVAPGVFLSGRFTRLSSNTCNLFGLWLCPVTSALALSPANSQSSSHIRTNYFPPFMSHTQPTASSSYNQASNFQLIINNALDLYKKRTKNDLLAHPLVTELQYCKSPSTILAVLQQQLHGLDQSRTSHERWTRCLDPTVNVLYTLSGSLGEGVGLVCLRT
jgi:hypothetical protein